MASILGSNRTGPAASELCELEITKEEAAPRTYALKYIQGINVRWSADAGTHTIYKRVSASWSGARKISGSDGGNVNGMWMNSDNKLTFW